MDLIFPHHEAEIAQMEATSGKKPLVRYWMHTGFLNVRGEKMSKSLGNFTTIKAMLQRCDAESFRFFVLSSHYRSPIDFSEEAVEQSRNGLERIRQLVKIIDAQLDTPDDSRDSDEIDANVIEARAKFIEHMDNDFNTTYALRTVFELVRDVNRRINEKTISRRALSDVKEMLREFGEILGVSFSATEKGPTGTAEDQTGNLIELLIDIRQKLREKKDWQLADEIRNGLNELNVVLEDEKAGKGKYSIKKVCGVSK